MKKAIILSCMLIPFLVYSQSSVIDEINSIVNAKLSSDEPGLFVGVVKEGNIIYENYIGLATLQHNVPIDQHTRSNIASTAKQFTALMILSLALEEKLDLEEDIRNYLPELYPNVNESIKISHLINHTSGIRDFYDLLSIQQKPWWQSNSGYILLTRIVELAAGQDFHDYSKNFFVELGMHSTTFLKNYMHVIPNQALPYSDWGNGIWQQYPMITNLYGDGFMYTTLKDQLIFEQAVQNAKKNNDSLLIQSQGAIPFSDITSYGFGLELEDRLNYKCVHHSGGTGSYHSQVVRYVEEGISIFVMSNNSRLWSGAIADEIANVLLSDKESEDTYDGRLYDVSIDVLNDITGHYLSPYNYLISIESEEGKLSWRNGNNNPIELYTEKANLYHLSYDSTIKVGFYEDSLILFDPSGKANEYRKLTVNSANNSDLKDIEGSYYSQELDYEFTLKLDREKLRIALSGRKKDYEVEVLNKDNLSVLDYFLKIERDQFNRVIGIDLTNSRAVNNRFTKKRA